MKKILVTGGTGFIGSYVVDNLIEKGYTPVIFDHKNTGHRKDVEVFLGDTRDFTAVSEAVAVCDGVIHLAGVLGTQETINEPRPAVETNIFGGLNVFQSCRNYGKKCVYIAVGNHTENNSYSISKTTAERFALMFNREHGTKIAVVRGLNAYGPRQKDQPVRKIMPNFVIPSINNEEITIYGDGEQGMDMIYVADLAEILVRALTEDHGVYDRVFEAGTGFAPTVNYIAKKVMKIAGGGYVKHVPMRPGETPRSVVVGAPETLRPLFGGEVPIFTSLEDGIRNTIDYYRGLYEKTTT